MSVSLVDAPTAQLRDVPAADMEFGYDRSRLHRTRRAAAVGGFSCVDAAIRRRCAPIARESLAFRKRTQPLESAERRLHLPEPGSRPRPVPDGIPPSAGALVDRAGLKGAAAGRRARLADARQLHRQRRRRDGAPTSDALIERCKREVRDAVRRRAARRNRVSGHAVASGCEEPNVDS